MNEINLSNIPYEYLDKILTTDDIEYSNSDVKIPFKQHIILEWIDDKILTENNVKLLIKCFPEYDINLLTITNNESNVSDPLISIATKLTSKKECENFIYKLNKLLSTRFEKYVNLDINTVPLVMIHCPCISCYYANPICSNISTVFSWNCDKYNLSIYEIFDLSGIISSDDQYILKCDKYMINNA